MEVLVRVWCRLIGWVLGDGWVFLVLLCWIRSKQVRMRSLLLYEWVFTRRYWSVKSRWGNCCSVFKHRIGKCDDSVGLMTRLFAKLCDLWPVFKHSRVLAVFLKCTLFLMDTAEGVSPRGWPSLDIRSEAQTNIIFASVRMRFFFRIFASLG